MATTAVQLKTDQFEDGINDLYDMDRFRVLDRHLKRLSDSARALANSGLQYNGGQAQSVFAKLQTQLTDYYHFLSRVDSPTRDCISEAEQVETRYSNRPEIYVHFNHILDELYDSCGRLRDQIENLEGPQLLSRVHTLRYYIDRAHKRLRDLRIWAESGQKAFVAMQIVDSANSTASRNWPELIEQMGSLSNRLTLQTRQVWSYGKGEEAHFITVCLQNLIDQLSSRNRQVMLPLDDAADALEKLNPQLKQDEADQLALEYSALQSLPSPKIISFYSGVQARLRSLRADHALNRAMRSEDGRKPSLESWHNQLRDGIQELSDLNQTSKRVGPVWESIVQVFDYLLPVQVDRFNLLKNNLVQCLAANLMKLDDMVDRSLARLDQFRDRVLSPQSDLELCNDCGLAFLENEDPMRCPKCSCVYHIDCLVDGKCVLCPQLDPGGIPGVPVKSTLAPRLLPIYLMLDSSKAMEGDAFTSMKQGCKLILNELESNPSFKNIARVSVIVLGGKADQIIRSAKVESITFPTGFFPRGKVRIRQGFECLENALVRDLRSAAGGSIYRPIVFLLSSGEWEDESSGLSTKMAKVIGIGCGIKPRTDRLGKVADMVMLLQDMTPQSIQQHLFLN